MNQVRGELITYHDRTWRVDYDGTQPILYLAFDNPKSDWFVRIGHPYRRTNTKLVSEAHQAWAYYQGWCSAKGENNADF